MIAEHIAAWHDGWTAFPEDAIFGTHDPAAIEAAVVALVRREFGVDPVECVFYESSVGSVTGLALADGRRIVVKAHDAAVTEAYLNAIRKVQETIWARGFPCPRPLHGPVRLALGLATIEELVDEGARRDAHDPNVRRSMAKALARLSEVTANLAREEIGPGHLSTLDGPLWPRPHDPRFSFTTAVPRIDELAAQALSVLREPAGVELVGHSDWSAKHFRFVGDEVSVVYDWDSLVLADEATLVGRAAAVFPAPSWCLDVPVAPTLDEARSFVSEYEQASGRTFDTRERRRLGAAATYFLAYCARCEACIAPPTEGSFQAALSREFLSL